MCTSVACSCTAESEEREDIDFCAGLHARVCVDADGFMQHDLVIIKKLELEGAGSQLEIHAKSESSLT